LSVKRSLFLLSTLLSPSIYAEEPAEEPAEESVEEAADVATEELVEPVESTVLPAEEPVEATVEATTEDPAEIPTAPTEEVAEEVIDPPAEASVEQPVVDALEESSMDDVVSPWTTVLPFGIPQFVQGESRRGWIYAGIQGVGLAASIYTGIEMRRLALEGEIDRELTYRLVSAGSVAVTALTWFVSVVDGSNLRIEAIDRAQAARDWDETQRSAIAITSE